MYKAIMHVGYGYKKQINIFLTYEIFNSVERIHIHRNVLGNEF